MAQVDKKLGDPADALPADEVTQLKKRARRRLIGAVALALLAAIVLPMVMDHQPAPPLKDIQVRIPSPDEGGALRAVPQPVVAKLSQEKENKPAAPPIEPTEPTNEVAKPAEKSEVKPVAKPESKPEAKPEPKPEPKPAADEAKRAQAVLTGKGGDEAWEVQLGAYQEIGRVKLLVGKLKELGIPTYTEKVDTPNGPRTRVRAGPFPSQEAAEKARVRVKIVGVDGPVAKKP
jgi:DedD protein